MFLTKVTYSMVNGAPLNVLDYGAHSITDAGYSTFDSTDAFKAGIADCVVKGQVLFIPAGRYLITDTLNIPNFTQISGEHQNMSESAYSTPNLQTVLEFAPTSSKSLFVASGTKIDSIYRRAYCIENLAIEGNSAVLGGNSNICIDVDCIQGSRFVNLAITNFQTGIRCITTLKNSFDFLKITNCYVSCILYDGGVGTTDVWTNCYIRAAPIGVQTNGLTLVISFVNCIFETLENYGVNLVKECFGWEFTGCYSENVPSTINANGAMFRVGYDGAVLTTQQQINVIGGFYTGNNDNPGQGHLLDCDYVSAATISNVLTTRYAYSVRATANTVNGAITIYGLNCIQQTGLTTGSSGKIYGAYANGVLNSGTLKQNAYFGNIEATGSVTVGIAGFVNSGSIIWQSSGNSPEGVVTAPVGSLYSRTNGGANTSLYVKESGTGNTGWVGK